ncbi:MAG: HEAT repeat domain-containing protein [Verrucomicrobiota bacterium]
MRILASTTVALILGATGSVAAADEAALFEEMMRTRDPAKAILLAERGEAAAPFLIQGLEKGGRPAALCAWALAQHPLPGAAKALRERLLGGDQVTGYFAARALGRIPSPENVAALASLLPNQPKGFWELSSGGVGRLQDAWDDQGRRYHAPAPAQMPNLRVAYAAMESLGQLGGTEASATLRRALDNDQYLIRYGAARGLGQMRCQSAAEKLSVLAEKDPVLIVRRAARQALAAIQNEIAADAELIRTSPIWLPAAPALAQRAQLPFATEPASSHGRSNPRRALSSDSGFKRPEAIAFIKTKNRSDATFGFRDSYFFPKTPRYHSGENLFTLTPPQPNGVLRNLTQLTDGEVQGVEVSFDGKRLLFAMRQNKNRDGFHLFEINADGSGLRQLTDGNCNDVDPCYLPDGRIAFCSDRCGWQEYYHQERSRVLYVMNADGTGLRQITVNPNQDYEPLALRDGRLIYSSYRFYAQDGSEGPLPGEWMGLARIETVLRTCHPDGTADQLFYGAMRGAFYVPMRPMPFGDQFAGWHGRGYHVGVSASQQKEMPDGTILCTTPAGLTLIDPTRAPLDCEMPIYPEVVNLAGGEEVYIHNYDEMNPIGRFTAPYPAGPQRAWVAHAPWHDLRANGYGIYLLDLASREMELVYDDPQMSDVDPVPLAPQELPLVPSSTLASGGATGRILCHSVFNSDQPYDKDKVRFVRVLEGVQMGQSIAANAAFRTRVLGTVPIQADGSFYVEVPADVPLRFELLDEDGRMLLHETEFNSVRPGETKGCAGCHEKRHEASQVFRPLALDHAPAQALRQRGDLIYMGHRSRPYNHVYRD